jgi:hypothetical protein
MIGSLHLTPPNLDNSILAFLLLLSPVSTRPASVGVDDLEKTPSRDARSDC